MARHKRNQPTPPSEPTLEISSLIDVCFLLLIYFLATSTIHPRENQLDLRLTGNSIPTSAATIDPPLVSIDSTGSVFTGTGIASQPLDADPASRELPLLRSHLGLYRSACRAAGSPPLVRINADPATSHQRVIDVLNALAAEEIRSVAFADPL
ncbi:MAG: ExbD/TolR family protein [Verrucomicrobiales bacterium]|nr:biopolymer transporter ExbD [Verrucomicrobiota bacterium JB025]